jgi:hypothetical protein
MEVNECLLKSVKQGKDVKDDDDSPKPSSGSSSSNQKYMDKNPKKKNLLIKMFKF